MEYRKKNKPKKSARLEKIKPTVDEPAGAPTIDERKRKIRVKGKKIARVVKIPAIGLVKSSLGTVLNGANSIRGYKIQKGLFCFKCNKSRVIPAARPGVHKAVLASLLIANQPLIKSLTGNTKISAKLGNRILMEISLINYKK